MRYFFLFTGKGKLAGMRHNARVLFFIADSQTIYCERQERQSLLTVIKAIIKADPM
jgi:hypothetical protein